MSNWHIDYRVKYHITFVYNDGRIEVVNDDMIIESRSEEEAKKIILEKHKNSSDPLTDFPDGCYEKIKSKKLEIDEIIKIWEY
jgi:hypothetical protein